MNDIAGRESGEVEVRVLPLACTSGSGNDKVHRAEDTLALRARVSPQIDADVLGDGGESGVRNKVVCRVVEAACAGELLAFTYNYLCIAIKGVDLLEAATRWH